MSIKITNIYGEEREIDESRANLVWYSNKDNEALYNAPVVGDGSFFTNYYVKDEIKDLDARIGAVHRPIQIIYAQEVGYYARQNDPDGELRAKITEYVKNNQDKFFDENGDFLPYNVCRVALLEAGIFEKTTYEQER